MNASKMCGYLVSVPIPWNEKGKFLVDPFNKAIEKLRLEGCDGIYLFGTSGEGYAVTDCEFKQIVDSFAEATTDFEGFRQVCCFGLSSNQVKARCELASERGFESVQITLPSWKELSNQELTRYFKDVCGSFAELSFLLYNNPRNKRKLKGEELSRIQQETPNLCGVKTGSGSWFDFYELLTESPSLQHFVTDPDFLFCHSLGAAGMIPSSNYALPRQCRAYYEAVLEGDLPTANRLQHKIVRFFAETAVPLLKQGYIDGAIDKAYARIGGMEMPLNMKSPYSKLADKDFRWLEKKIAADFLEIEDAN